MQSTFKLPVLIFALVAMVLAVATGVMAWTRLNKVDRQLQLLMAEIADLKTTMTIPATPGQASSFPMASPAAASSSAFTGNQPAPEIAKTVADLKSLINQISQRVDQVEQQLTAKSTTATTPAKSTPREYVIYLGSGSTVNRDWTEITAAGVSLDMNTYKNIREVRFEAGLSILNGEARARLYDQTKKEPFYVSEVYNNTSAGTWVTSSPVQVSGGSRYYSVQLRSTSGEMANLIGARLKIIAD